MVPLTLYSGDQGGGGGGKGDQPVDIQHGHHCLLFT